MNNQDFNQFEATNEAQATNTTPPTEQKKKSSFATAGLVLGIVGISTSFIPIVNNASFFLGILAIVFGIIALIKRASIGKSSTALTLGILAIVITLVMQSAWSKAVDEIEDIVDEFDNEIDFMAGGKTDEILDKYLSVTIGSFKVIEGEFYDETELSVTVKNKADEVKSYDVTVEAVDKDGNRIATDTIYANDLGAGQGQSFKIFQFVSEDDMEAMKNATFRVSSASMY